MKLLFLRYRGSRIHSGADRRVESDPRGQHDEREWHGSLAVHRPFSQRRAEMGGHDAHDIRGSRIMDAATEEMAVPRGYLRGR